MNPLLCVIAYPHKDADLARQLLDWIAELGGCLDHSCLLVVDSKVDPATRTGINQAAEKSFAYTEEITFNEPAAPQNLKWPVWRYFANKMFETAAHHIAENYRVPFLWLEPDATPIRADWLEKIAEAYYAQPKRFMGPIIRNTNPNRPAYWPERHMAGVAVYPVGAINLLRKWCGTETTWDLGGGSDVVPRASKTRLIQHNYGPSEESGWSFLAKPPAGDSSDTVVIFEKSPSSECVLFHRCKDGTLIECLRATSKKRRRQALIGSPQDFKAMEFAGRNGPGKVEA